jgi:hypothetical protein
LHLKLIDFERNVSKPESRGSFQKKEAAKRLRLKTRSHSNKQ